MSSTSPTMIQRLHRVLQYLQRLERDLELRAEVWKERRHLLELDNRLLRDIGKTRADAEAEAAYGFTKIPAERSTKLDGGAKSEERFCPTCNGLDNAGIAVR